MPVVDIDIEYTLYIYGGRPPRLRRTGIGRGNAAGIFLAVIIQGGNNAPNSAIIPQCDRLPTMI